MRTLNREDMVREFMEKAEQEIDAVWTPELLEKKMSYISEEFEELHNEYVEIQLMLEDGKKPSKLAKAKFLKEMSDLQYVLSGMSVALKGLPLQQGFVRTHNSNMSKFGPNGEVYKNKKGKVVKGPYYQPPVLIDLV